MPSIIHFEIHASDVARAIRFYRAVFGWKIEQRAGPDEPEYYAITTKMPGESGINGGLLRRRGPVPTDSDPVRAFICTVGVDSIDASILGVERNGGRITTDKLAIAGVGWMCYAEDPEGNLFGLWQKDPDAR